jgi:hypothetical protein
MDRMIRELSLSNSDKITLGNCDANGLCDTIEFQVPTVTNDAMAGTIYHSDGSIKWGAEGHEGWTIKFALSNNKLVRIVPREAVGYCCFGQACAEESCSILTQANCLAQGGTPGPDGSDCSSAPCVNRLGACCLPNGCNHNIPRTQCAGTWKCGRGCGSCGQPCFLSGTPILLSDGSTKPIEEIKVGDEIMAFDEETSGLVKDKVSKTFAHKATEYLIINNHLKVTPNHPVYNNGEWIEIGKLNIGDSLLNSQGKTELITDIKKFNDEVDTYNLEVNPYHTYIAGGYVVHNKIPGGGTPIGGDGPGGPPGPEGFLRNLFESVAFALEDIITLTADIVDLSFENLSAGTPNIIKITVTAQRKTILGNDVTFTLSSTVTLRNTPEE